MRAFIQSPQSSNPEDEPKIDKKECLEKVEERSAETEIGAKRTYFKFRGDDNIEDNQMSKRGRFESNSIPITKDLIEEEKLCPALKEEQSSRYNQELIKRLLIEE